MAYYFLLADEIKMENNIIPKPIWAMDAPIICNLFLTILIRYQVLKTRVQMEANIWLYKLK